MEEADIGLIGLGVMGENLALNIADNGYKVAVYNRTADKVDAFLANAGDLKSNVMGSGELATFISMLKRPRSVIIMVKAGDPVDQVIAELKPLLEEAMSSSTPATPITMTPYAAFPNSMARASAFWASGCRAAKRVRAMAHRSWSAVRKPSGKTPRRC